MFDAPLKQEIKFFFDQRLMLTRLKELKEFLGKKRINVAFARVD